MTRTVQIWRSWIWAHVTPPPCPRSSTPSSSSRSTARSTRGCEMTSPSSWSSWKRTRSAQGLDINLHQHILFQFKCAHHTFISFSRWRYCTTSSSCSTMPSPHTTLETNSSWNRHSSSSTSSWKCQVGTLHLGWKSTNHSLFEAPVAQFDRKCQNLQKLQELPFLPSTLLSLPFKLSLKL